MQKENLRAVNANSSITISGDPASNSANSVVYDHGPLAPNIPQLNEVFQPVGPGPLLLTRAKK